MGIIWHFLTLHIDGTIKELRTLIDNRRRIDEKRLFRAEINHRLIDEKSPSIERCRVTKTFSSEGFVI